MVEQAQKSAVESNKECIIDGEVAETYGDIGAGFSDDSEAACWKWSSKDVGFPVDIWRLSRVT